MTSPISSHEPPGRSRRVQQSGRRTRIAFGVVIAVVVLAVPLGLFALRDGSSSSEEARGSVVTPLDRVRAAVGLTAAAGSYEMDTETTTSSPPRSTTCTSTARSVTCSGGGGGGGYSFRTHSVVNFEPYAMVAESDTPFGFITLHVNTERAWQKNGLNLGYVGDTAPGLPIPEYADAVLGTLGPGPGALAMISIASRGGSLNLEEDAVATAAPAGSGTVQGIDVTYYDVTIDFTRLADAPGLSDAQRRTIEEALPILERSGYAGTTERIGVDAAGYVREVSATTTMGDGSTTTRHSVLYNFGCAPRVTMPNEPPADDTPIGPCLPDPTSTSSSTTTTSPPASTSTSVVPVTSTTTAPTPSTTVPSSSPPSTTAPTTS